MIKFSYTNGENFILHHHDSIHDNSMNYDVLLSEYVKSVQFNFNKKTITIQYNSPIEYDREHKCYTSFEIDNSYKRFVFLLCDRSGEIILTLPIYNSFVKWQSKDGQIITYSFEYSKLWFTDSVLSNKKIMEFINEHNNCENKEFSD